MNFERSKKRIPLWAIWAVALTAITTALIVWYWLIDPTNSKLLGFVGGIATSLLVYLVTFLTLLRPILELDRFRRMGIRGLLDNRHDQTYYHKLVARSRQRVDVMGASCSRFVEDFLDVDSDDKVLIDALTKYQHLKVRLLIPADSYMSQEARSRTSRTLAQVAAAQKRFESRIELRRFDDKVRHSFVIADDDVVAGPVFDDDKSRHAPAVHVAAETLFGQKYCAHFDVVWQEAKADAKR